MTPFLCEFPCSDSHSGVRATLSFSLSPTLSDKTTEGEWQSEATKWARPHNGILENWNGILETGGIGVSVA